MKAICGSVSTQAIKFKISLILFSLFLSKVTCNHISEAVFESWNTQIHVVGTDIESGGSDDENSDGDTANDDEVIDLSSSMMDLGIDGSGISQ